MYELILFWQLIAHCFTNNTQQSSKQQLETFPIPHVIGRFFQQPANKRRQLFIKAHGTMKK